MPLKCPKKVFIERLLPILEYERSRLNFGSPYRKEPKTRGRNADLRKFDLLGLALWFLKSSRQQYRICTQFGLVPASVYVWLDCALEVLFKVVKYKKIVDFAVRWPSPNEIVASSGLFLRNSALVRYLNVVFCCFGWR